MPTLLDLVEPVVPEWSVGTLAVAWDDANDRMVLVAEELLTEEEQQDAPDVARATVPADPARRSPRSSTGLGSWSPAAGRRARLCGGPLDPEGHACPRLN